jgi:hypothetical protein
MLAGLPDRFEVTVERDGLPEELEITAGTRQSTLSRPTLAGAEMFKPIASVSGRRYAARHTSV